jgi:glucose-6-phosphate-specific signal transduction histidine kinase
MGGGCLVSPFQRPPIPDRGARRSDLVDRGAAAAVTLRWQPDHVVTEVLDAGGDAVTAGLPFGGFGLTGLAERATLAGGHLETAPTTDG